MNLRSYVHHQDYPAVIALWSAAGPGVHVGRSDSEAEIRKKLERDPDLFLVAEQDGVIVGTVLGGFDGRRGLVYHLAVRPDCRQHGIGSALMEELERRLRAKGCLRCYLLLVPGNDRADEFYRARGWDRMEIYSYAKDLE